MEGLLSTGPTPSSLVLNKQSFKGFTFVYLQKNSLQSVNIGLLAIGQSHQNLAYKLF